VVNTEKNRAAGPLRKSTGWHNAQEQGKKKASAGFDLKKTYTLRIVSGFQGMCIFYLWCFVPKHCVTEARILALPKTKPLKRKSRKEDHLENKV